MRFSFLFPLVAVIPVALACNSCDSTKEVIHERHVRRMQPGATPAQSGPRGPLEWGQLNFIQTTDTHGWLEGHIKEQNYGADWGDFVSFVKHMRHKAGRLGVDLLLVDTGDLHDGNGLSDSTSPNGLLSNPIHQEVDYDILTIGNHELYVTEIAYETFANFSKSYGEKYLTSNVEILNPATNQYEYIGNKYRYFTTAQGLRIMSFGILFDFNRNSNVSRVTKAADMIKQQWFLDAVNFDQPIDLFILIGHNPVRLSDPVSTFGTVLSVIRSLRPNIPVQVLGGHTHIRDFTTYDEISTGIEAGRYCETVGWLSMSGINSSSFHGHMQPRGVPNPTQKATNTSKSSMVYSRRYLDWNRRTFAYHAIGSQDNTFDTSSNSTFDLHSGTRVSKKISEIRKNQNLTTLYGCAPSTYCISCKPIGDPGNIYSLLPVAVGATVINPARETIPRLILMQTGGVRYDLVKGPFTYDDSFIVSPFKNNFQYVSLSWTKMILPFLNAGKPIKRTPTPRWGSMPLSQALPQTKDTCEDPIIPHTPLQKRTQITRRQKIVTPGYTTTDDFGTDGDDTPHSQIPAFPRPNVIQGNGSFPTDGTDPTTVDLVFVDFVARDVVAALKSLEWSGSMADVQLYMPKEFTTQSYLPLFVKKYWQQNMPNCPGGSGIGYDD
ncbi:hypothetical protein HYFRA_00002913 [Hymenoscyphus fraxineus]|uniref:Calcineurin-like phosphoesterase domain-containing protein n=1 Tax=Hymenoscyphus fraxineus TaxID=746836 RepID=A0A9N9KPG4_9HELO|nr:hypothetical protein HYFRA_00002913 [Hymenoscyphus fraxineus]